MNWLTELFLCPTDIKNTAGLSFPMTTNCVFGIPKPNSAEAMQRHVKLWDLWLNVCFLESLWSYSVRGSICPVSFQSLYSDTAQTRIKETLIICVNSKEIKICSYWSRAPSASQMDCPTPSKICKWFAVAAPSIQIVFISVRMMWKLPAFWECTVKELASLLKRGSSICVIFPFNWKEFFQWGLDQFVLICKLGRKPYRSPITSKKLNFFLSSFLYKMWGIFICSWKHTKLFGCCWNYRNTFCCCSNLLNKLQFTTLHT